MCPKAFFLIVSRSRMMFHATSFLSEKFSFITKPILPTTLSCETAVSETAISQLTKANGKLFLYQFSTFSKKKTIFAGKRI